LLFCGTGFSRQPVLFHHLSFTNYHANLCRPEGVFCDEGSQPIEGLKFGSIEILPACLSDSRGRADRLAGYLVYFALAAAALTFLITHNVRSTISVVIVAGACGIAAGTPLAILGAIGRAAQQGSIIKGGIYLESLANIHTVLLDKTGTLT
jgi:hypothetical protein